MFGDDIPLGVARRWLREQAAGHGAECPVCRQNVKVYTRKIRAVQAAMLIRAWRAVGRDKFRRPDLLPGPEQDFAKLRFWGLIEDLGERRDDGGKAGWYAITRLGEDWVRGSARVPRDAYVYDNRLLRLDEESPSWGVRDALGEKFDYAELMGASGGGDSPI